MPRCHLSQFCVDENRSAIHLFNIIRDKVIYNAPVKGQCSKTYFYGINLNVEKALQTIEGIYSRCIRDVLAGNFDESTAFGLKTFAVLQFFRTEAAALRSLSFMKGFVDLIDPSGKDGLQAQVWNQEQALASSLKMMLDSEKFFEDLKPVIILNRSDADFLTSDDPAVLVNRYYAQRMKQDNFGIASSGLMLCLPLTSKHYFLAFDRLVYTIEGTCNGFLETYNPRDIDSLNELQAIKAASNVYFARKSQESYVRSIVAKSTTRRKGTWVEHSTFKLQSECTKQEIYVRTSPDDFSGSGTGLISISPKYPIPSSWFSSLKFRHKPITFNNGSAVGHVRRKEWLTASGRSARRTSRL
ncbi:DUF4238 domain-containing protein [Methylobacterium nodulans]|uniref:DUF4238 domain-containing protein n=1 Tax=Methylobacterium nodulans TaxID=114616 RepID=UPI001FCC9DF1|nr:DUF4238 domain-containing protein [Methylobacterium nodulans]